MNNLNSILIEGMLVMNPEYTENTGRFIIQVDRYYKKNDEAEKESCYFKIIMNGKLAEDMKEILTIKKNVRVVGRLHEIIGNVAIIADHISIKPDETGK